MEQSKIRELLKEVNKRDFNLKEFLTRSEGPELFTDLINTKLLDGFNGVFPSMLEDIYETIPLSQGRTIRFPSVRGIRPDHVPELAEYQRSEWEITGVSVEVDKIGGLLGISREMIDDNQVGLIGIRAKMAGAGHAQQKQEEMAKCLSFYSTGPAVSTGSFGFTDHGVRYPAIGYTNVFSATALGWETILARSRHLLWTQQVTITAKGIQFPFPVVPDFLLANPHHEMDIRKVINASITTIVSGIQGLQVNNVAGTNVFQNIISNLFFNPTLPTGQCIIGMRKLGAVVVQKDGLEVDEYQNFYYDANDLKTRERYKPAVIEDRYFIDVQMSN